MNFTNQNVGILVTSILNYFGASSAEDLTQLVSNRSNQSMEYVCSSVRRTLRCGLRNGYLVKTKKNKYALPARDYETDNGDEWQIHSNKGKKRKAASSTPHTAPHATPQSSSRADLARSHSQSQLLSGNKSLGKTQRASLPPQSSPWSGVAPSGHGSSQGIKFASPHAPPQSSGWSNLFSQSQPGQPQRASSQTQAKSSAGQRSSQQQQQASQPQPKRPFEVHSPKQAQKACEKLYSDIICRDERHGCPLKDIITYKRCQRQLQPNMPWCRPHINAQDFFEYRQMFIKYFRHNPLKTSVEKEPRMKLRIDQLSQQNDATFFKKVEDKYGNFLEDYYQYIFGYKENGVVTKVLGIGPDGLQLVPRRITGGKCTGIDIESGNNWRYDGDRSTGDRRGLCQEHQYLLTLMKGFGRTNYTSNPKAKLCCLSTGIIGEAIATAFGNKYNFSLHYTTTRKKFEDRVTQMDACMKVYFALISRYEQHRICGRDAEDYRPTIEGLVETGNNDAHNQRKLHPCSCICMDLGKFGKIFNFQ